MVVAAILTRLFLFRCFCSPFFESLYNLLSQFYPGFFKEIDSQKYRLTIKSLLLEDVELILRICTVYYALIEYSAVYNDLKRKPDPQ